MSLADLRNSLPPTAGYVWMIEDPEIKLHDKKKIDKGCRPALIACVDSLLQ